MFKIISRKEQKMITYKKSLLVLAFLSTIFVFNPLPVFADATVISIQPPVSNPTVGSFFDVIVDITGVNDLYAFQFDIAFNPAVISAVSVAEGSFLPGGGGSFFIPGTIDNTTGAITYTADSLISPSTGVSGDGTLADISFQALTGGTSLIELSNIFLLDPNFGYIPFELIGGTVSPVSSSIPEPTTMLLLGFGMVGLVGFRKKARQ
jgi:hypothetical protein